MTGLPRTSRIAKARWLWDHRHEWGDAPDIIALMNSRYTTSLPKLHRMMVEAGLYSAKTYAPDVYGSIIAHMNYARELHRKGIIR